MDGPRGLKPDEYEELVSLLTKAFNYNDPKSRYDLKNLRKLWLFDHDIDDLLMIKEDGRIVSHVGILPSEVSVRGCILKVGRIGDVATDEDYRRKGLASALLKHAVGKMAREGYDLSSLGGVRGFYGRFGWELAGEQKGYLIDQRSIRAVPESGKIKSWKYSGDESDLQKIAEIHDREPIRTLRSNSAYRLLFDNDFVRVREPWLAEAKGYSLCYAVLERQQQNVIRIVECGGDPQAFRLYLKSLFENGLEKAQVACPNICTPFTPVLDEISSSYDLSPLRMIRVINLHGLVRKLSPLLEQRMRRRRLVFPFSLTLEISDTGETVTLDYEKSLRISRRPGKHRVTLDQRSMVRLLFGPGKPGQNFSFEDGVFAILDALFPVEFYLWQMDRR